MVEITPDLLLQAYRIGVFPMGVTGYQDSPSGNRLCFFQSVLPYV